MTWESEAPPVKEPENPEFVDEFATGGAGGDIGVFNGDFGDGGFGVMGSNNGFGPADGDNGFSAVGGGADGACRNCGQEGHFVRDCPQPRKSLGACFNCGQEGHTKAECTQPRVFNKECKVCKEIGHPAAECPERVCRNCLTKGHNTKDCKDSRAQDLSRVPDKTPEEAIALMKQASDERDLDDFREAVKIYAKAMPLASYVAIEKICRDRGFNVYLIGLSKDFSKSWAIVDLQGKLDCEFVIGYFFSPHPQRVSLKDRWPSTPEENVARLANCGVVDDRRVTLCSICGELGHTSRGCKEEKPEIERVEVKCANCNEVGHRVRDCPVVRVDKFACRNCGKSGHTASECTEPRSAEGVECKRCNEVGHFAKDCPNSAPRGCRNCGEEGHMARDCDKPRNPANVTCRNCDETGHFSKECPKPKDWSRVTCPNCGEKGHGPKKCPQPPKESGDFGNSGGDFGNSGGFNNTGGFDNSSGNDFSGGDKHDWNADAGASTAAGGW